MDSPLKVLFWGTRGLVSSPRRDTAKFGGNTICTQILSGDDIIVVDAGFGITNLGEELINTPDVEAHILFSHLHWDHIQGLPFFHPIYIPTTRMHLYSPFTTDFLHEHLNGLFDGSYSPFEGIDSMPADIQFHQIEDSRKIGDLDVTSSPLDHGKRDPVQGPTTYAYRFSSVDQSLVMATDHEARNNQFNRRFIEFAKGTQMLIHDAQFTDSEYASKEGWGHSTARLALDNALASGAKRCILTHHDPGRSDADIDAEYRDLKSDPQYASLDFEYAKENVEYEIQADKNIGKAG